MGSGYLYVCKNCKKRYSVQLGVGKLFPQIYEETTRLIDRGHYGPEWQKIYRHTPYVAVDAALELYLCDNCRNWKSDKNLSLYEPNDIAQIKTRRYGIKTVEEWGHIPYVLDFELEQDYHLIKEYPHTCDKCGNPMRKIDKDHIPDILSCPKCGSDNERKPVMMMWD